MMVCPGNHDVEQQNVLSNYFVSYSARFKVTACHILLTTAACS